MKTLSVTLPGAYLPEALRGILGSLGSLAPTAETEKHFYAMVHAMVGEYTGGRYVPPDHEEASRRVAEWPAAVTPEPGDPHPIPGSATEPEPWFKNNGQIGTQWCLTSAGGVDVLIHVTDCGFHAVVDVDFNRDSVSLAHEVISSLFFARRILRANPHLTDMLLSLTSRLARESVDPEEVDVHEIQSRIRQLCIECGPVKLDRILTIAPGIGEWLTQRIEAWADEKYHPLEEEAGRFSWLAYNGYASQVGELLAQLAEMENHV